MNLQLLLLWRRLSPSQWVLRALCVLGLLVGLCATALSGVWPAWWLILLVGGLGVLYAALPEAAMGTVAMGLVLAWWGLAFHEDLQSSAIVGAAGLVVSHVAGLLAAYGPENLAVDRATVVVWAYRGAAVLLISPLLYAVAWLVDGQGAVPGIWVAGLVAGLASVVAIAVAFAPDRSGQ